MIRVFRLSDVGKNLVKVMILIISIVLLTRFFSEIKKIDLKKIIENRLNSFENKTFIEMIDENFDEPVIEQKNENALSSEIGFIQNAFHVDSVFSDEQNIEQQEIEEDNNLQEFPTTEVVAEHNKKDIFDVTYSSVKIRNQTSFQLTEEMMTPNIEFDKSNIIIYHTHTSESYTPTEANQYQASGNFRTLDTEHSVVRVGEELKKELEKQSINVIHDATFHDYPEYNGSYDRSLRTAQNLLKTTSADIVIDLHRDALGDSTYGPSVMIGEEKAAQLMFVIGSNEGGLTHPNWNDNLKIAIKIQEKANEMYPGLFKPIIFRKYRYNQHVTKGACIIEVGATGNTLEECLVSMKYLAQVISQI